MISSPAQSDVEVNAYERDLADHLGVAHVVAVSSGTAALHTALYAVGVRPGDEVLVPALAVVMSAAPVRHLGAQPVFVDCNAEGTDFDYRDLEAKVTDRVRAVLPVHLWGRAGDTARMRSFAEQHDIAVVADCCQALGTTVDGIQVGTEATIGCYSTHKMKLLSTDEGGFLTTNDDECAARGRAYRSHWQTPPENELPLSRIAHNFRLAGPLAAIGRRELPRLEKLVQQRLDRASMLARLLSDLPQVLPAHVPTGQRWNHYSPLLHLHLDRPRAFCEHLAQQGVPNSTGTFRLIPLDQRPVFTRDTRPRCHAAAEFLDGILAVVLTRHDDQQRIREYAETIAREVTRWASN
ncbi:DegT/DnrJ/EryC1/StrS family aminotransferase [Amycolatopsis pigmentata]|uniref:DegT/DnrJ/EryC1/StrS family aminotransferase n=1 Tax=Amycolatopsis pigmentata TaxID=450801 RepID=A0ABW5G692_9PSEU